MGKVSDNDENIIAFLIGQIGRDDNYSTSVMSGHQILQDCYNLIGNARNIIGGRVILIECKRSEKVCRFYEDKGFLDITEEDNGLKQYIRFI